MTAPASADQYFQRAPAELENRFARWQLFATTAAKRTHRQGLPLSVFSLCMLLFNSSSTLILTLEIWWNQNKFGFHVKGKLRI
ncbi:hypothetical protein RHMOL_Rhmol13G0141800 [Rhododendron molle]|uniref:Uncharacterized protein n=1 Tax=Rhododendron molle TaxID=49168 RepID=A0ACC0L739_RHOML|nr:hypothetical protein RHMOL_Rhmol13G0141800 [Rhododendron molle]